MLFTWLVHNLLEFEGSLKCVRSWRISLTRSNHNKTIEYILRHKGKCCFLIEVYPRLEVKNMLSFKLSIVPVPSEGCCVGIYIDFKDLIDAI